MEPRSLALILVRSDRTAQYRSNSEVETQSCRVVLFVVLELTRVIKQGIGWAYMRGTSRNVKSSTW